MIKYVMLMILTSCATTPKQAVTTIAPNSIELTVCNSPSIILLNDAQWWRQDAAFVNAAHRECRKQYGNRSCLTTLYKSGQNDFTAVCRDNTIQIIKEQ